MAHTLVPSDYVETASVYGRGDEKLGTIERLMLEKKSGIVAYAAVRCGGLLKREVRHYPVPWVSLRYDVARKAYTTNLTLEKLQSGPSELDGEAFDWGNRSAVYRRPQYWSRRRNGLIAWSVMGRLLSGVRVATPHLQTGRASYLSPPRAAGRSALPRERFNPLAQSARFNAIAENNQIGRSDPTINLLQVICSIRSLKVAIRPSNPATSAPNHTASSSPVSDRSIAMGSSEVKAT